MDSGNCCDNVCAACEGDHPACWKYYCAQAQLEGVDAYLRPVDTEVEVSNVNIPVFLRDVSIDTACEVEATGELITVGGEPLTCDGPSWNGLPDGWPDGEVNNEELFSIVQAPGLLQSIDLPGFPHDLQAKASLGGQLQFNIDCPESGACLAGLRGALRSSPLSAQAEVAGQLLELGIDNAVLFVRSNRDGVVVDGASGVRVFRFAEGSLDFTAMGTARLNGFRVDERVLTAHNADPVELRVTRDGDLTSSPVQLSWHSGALTLNFLGHAQQPTASTTLTSKPR